MAPTILIFSIAMGADYSFELIECPNFSCIIKSILGGVNSMLSGIKVKSQVLDADCQNIKGYEIQALKSHQCNDAMQTQPIFQKRIFIKSLFIFIRIFCTIFAWHNTIWGYFQLIFKLTSAESTHKLCRPKIVQNIVKKILEFNLEARISSSM